MPTAIIAGLPPDSDHQIRSALLKQQAAFPAIWQVIRIRSKGLIPGIAPSQLEILRQTASQFGGAHLLIFRGRERGREKRDEDMVVAEVAPYFRVRWLDHTLLRLIPRSMGRFFEAINGILDEELTWSETVKPRDTSCCLLLPECAFSADPGVRHLWTAATEPGIECIMLAARAIERFRRIHWVRNTGGARGPAPWNWVDDGGRVFDHRVARHYPRAPFPRSWKFSHQVEAGFHYDVKSRDSRAFHVVASDGSRHDASGTGHINIDPHGCQL